MNYKFTNVLMFAAGAAIGSAVTWKVMQTKCEQMIQTEVDAFKLSYAEAMSATQEQTDDETESEEDDEDEDEEGGFHQVNWEELEDLDEDEEYEPDESDLSEYEELTNLYSSEKGGAEKVAKEPHVISPYDFGEKDGYKTISLTYYADGVLENEKHKVVTNIDELVGEASLNTFGEYEDDSVFVRNDQLRTDFEILKDYRTYSEVLGDSPDRVGDE